MQRENPEASIANYNEDRKKQWTWSQYDGNRPTKWMQKLFKSTTLPPLGPLQPPRVIYELDPLGTREEHYLYDADGNRTTVVDAQGDTLNVVRYNRLNLPEEYVSADGDTLKYVYSADGEKLYVEERSSATSGAQGTEYAANYRIENGEVTMIHTDAGYYTPTGLPPGAPGPSYVHLWYLKDHLGNNRVLADATTRVPIATAARSGTPPRRPTTSRRATSRQVSTASRRWTRCARSTTASVLIRIVRGIR